MTAAGSAYAATEGTPMFVRKVCGFFGTVGFAAYARSLRKSVARFAHPQELGQVRSLVTRLRRSPTGGVA